jgi:hypothetical protein
MNAQDITAIIASEIDGNWTLTNDHGVDLRTCLVVPRKVACRNTFPQSNSGDPMLMWIVLEECPSHRDGYLILFDEARRQFGLGIWDEDVPVFLGFHGTFVDALWGM